MKQITQFFLEGESPPLNVCTSTLMASNAINNKFDEW